MKLTCFGGSFLLSLFWPCWLLVAAACGLSLFAVPGLSSPAARGICFPTRDQLCVPCTGRPILNHCAARGVPTGSLWGLNEIFPQVGQKHPGLPLGRDSTVRHESESEVAHSCPTLCDPMDCSLPGSTIHGIFQARVLEWVAISFCRRSS